VQSVGTSVLVEVLSADCQNDKVVVRTMIGLTTMGPGLFEDCPSVRDQQG
jgi:hypothetical protein